MATEDNYAQFPLDMDASLFAECPDFLRVGKPRVWATLEAEASSR